MATAVASSASARSDSRQAYERLADFARRRRTERLRVLCPERCTQNLAPVIRRFSELSGVTVDLATVPRNVGKATLMNEVLGRGTEDVVVPATFDIPDLAVAEAIRPLDDLPPVRLDWLFGGRNLYSLGDQFDGTTYGYQTDGNAMTAFYNRRFFDNPRLADTYAARYGRSLKPPSTWTELDRQAIFLSDVDPENFGFGGVRGLGFVETEFWLRLHAKGVWPMASNLEPLFQGDVGNEVLEEMRRVGPAMYASTDQNRDVRLKFQEGRVMTILGYGGTQKSIRKSSVVRDVSHGWLPGGEGRDSPGVLSHFHWGWSYAVAAGAQDPELAHAFCLFAVTPQMSLAAVQAPGGFFDPFRDEHYADSRVQSIYGDAFLHVHRQAMTNAIPDFYVRNRSEYFGTLGRWLMHALEGRLPVREALSRAADDWTLLNVVSGQSAQTQRWNALRKKYPPQVAAYLQETSV